MKICLIAESYPPALGGVEYALQKLVEGFIDRGHEVRVVSASWQRHSAAMEKRGALTLVRVFTLPVFKRLWFILFCLPGVFRAVRWADVVQGSTFAGGPPAFLAGWLLGKKRVLIVHEAFGRRWFRLEPNVMRALFYAVTEWIIVHLPFDHYVAVSEYTKKSLQSLGISGKKITVIYHGDSALETPALPRERARRELGFGKTDFVFLSYGRTGVTKGFEYFAEAMPEIHRQIPKARFALILSGYDSRISRHIRKSVSLLPTGVCRLLEPVTREMLSTYLLASDCVVIPSLSEGFGFGAREACNAQKAVVATRAGALPEVISGRHLFVEPGSAQALAEGCVKASRGEVSDAPPKVFSWERAVEEYLRLYAQLADK
jgi:glycosyltransferase involved in cell wall biosynthesis